MLKTYTATQDRPAQIDLREVGHIEFVRPVPLEFRVMRGEEEVIPWTAGVDGLVSLYRPRIQNGELLKPTRNMTDGELGPLEIEVKGFYTYTVHAWER